MAKDTATGLKNRGIIQETLPKRLSFVCLEKAAGQEIKNVVHLKGFLSTCYLADCCFNEYDKPLEFFLSINVKTGQTTVMEKL